MEFLTITVIGSALVRLQSAGEGSGVTRERRAYIMARPGEGNIVEGITIVHIAVGRQVIGRGISLFPEPDLETAADGLGRNGAGQGAGDIDTSRRLVASDGCRGLHSGV